MTGGTAWRLVQRLMNWLKAGGEISQVLRRWITYIGGRHTYGQGGDTRERKGKWGNRQKTWGAFHHAILCFLIFSPTVIQKSFILRRHRESSNTFNAPWGGKNQGGFWRSLEGGDTNVCTEVFYRMVASINARSDDDHVYLLMRNETQSTLLILILCYN